MLLKKNGDWVDDLDITEKLWKDMMKRILSGILTLLESAEKLLTIGGNEAVSAGLYTYAVEEYGKILLLQKYKPFSEKTTIKYKSEFRDHLAKFNVAIKNLPVECTTLHKGFFKLGVFKRGIFDTDQIADLEARLTIFYADFNMSGDSIKSIPLIDRNRLDEAIGKFKKIALKITIP